MSYYLVIAALLLMGMILATTVVMILVILLARVLPARHVRSWMPIAVMLAMVIIMLGQQPMTQWFSAQIGLIMSLAEGLLNPGRLALVALVVGAVALLASLVAYRIFDTTFHGGWDRLREVPTLRKPAPAAAARRGGLNRVFRPLPEPLRSFLAKEWLELRRDPQGIMGIANPLLLVLVLVLIPLMSSGCARATLQPLLFWFMLMMIALLVSSLPAGTSMLTVAREGRKIALLRSAPISMAEVLRGKLWATLTPMALSWLVVLLASGIFLKFPVWQIGVLVGVAIWSMSGASVAAMAIGGLKIDFEAEELKQRVPILMSYLTMALNGVFGLLTVMASVWLMVRLLPERSVALVVTVLSGFSGSEWLLSGELWIPIALVGSQAAFWIGTRMLWGAAVRRLESWEGG